jgi:hypothetical protein
MKERKSQYHETGLRRLAPLRLCLHWINGRTQIAKTCIKNYQCERCAFEQWLDEVDEWGAVLPRAA